MRFSSSTLLLTLALLVSMGVQAEDPDPWENTNRRVFAVNDFFDRVFLKPVAKGYQKIVPKPVQRGVSNIFNNIDTPATAINQFLQGKPREGLSDTGRFLVNSTIGIGGIFDVATPMGFAKHQEDFGQTFGRWGAESGPHVVIPLRGSSTVRDAIGLAFDAAASPLRLISNTTPRNAAYALYFIDTRVGLLAAENLLNESGDKYLFLRDAYLQRRAFLVSDGAAEEEDPFLDDEEWEDE